MANVQSDGLRTPELEVRSQLFKALGHSTRLLILNLIKMKPRHGEELAAILKMPPATVSHHLTKLTEVGLLETAKEQYYQMYKIVNGSLNRSLSELVLIDGGVLETGVVEDAFQQKVLRTFFKHGRLVSIPTQLKKRQIIMQKLVQEFAPAQDYTENEVNHILVEFHDDVAYLRRELISQGLMERAKGIYRRL
ncbi:MAG: metalloregulator ArsR/SmtB family transcription factor [Caldilineaceae bacterium]